MILLLFCSSLISLESLSKLAYTFNILKTVSAKGNLLLDSR